MTGAGGRHRTVQRINGRKTLSPGQKKAAGICFGLALLAFWQILASAIGKSYLLPSPAEVIRHLCTHAREIFTVHLPATLLVVVIGGLLSVVIGFLLAVAMDADKRIEQGIYPLLTLTQTIPVMCIAPVFVLWFGYSVTMRVLVVILTNFFTVAVNVFDGLKATQPERMELMQTFGASKAQQFFYLRLPTAIPNLITALKITVPWSVIGAAVAEWLGAPAGLGTYSRSCMMSLDAAGLLAPLVVLTALALGLNAVLKQIEKGYKK